MTSEDVRVLEAMATFGGSFVRALAGAAAAADAENLAKIKATWPDYWTKYRVIANDTRSSDEHR